MSESKTVYCLIRKRIPGKIVHGNHYVYENGDWKPDNEHIIADCIYGYDASEEPDSPYGFGNTDIMDELEYITEEEANEVIRRIRERGNV
ncbi:MAG: hypothetical protein IKS32_12145 [Solobacterium sp.]|nr:hypothetical protein [Solobacterium sp.]